MVVRYSRATRQALVKHSPSTLQALSKPSSPFLPPPEVILELLELNFSTPMAIFVNTIVFVGDFECFLRVFF